MEFIKPRIMLFLAFTFGVDSPDKTGKMSQSDKRGVRRRGEVAA